MSRFPVSRFPFALPRLSVILALAALLTTLIGPPPAAARSAATARVDFNKDGYEDLAIGIPSEDVEISPGVNVRDAGAVMVLYGSSAGLRPTAGPGDQIWRQGGGGLDGTAEAEDHFGAALAIGDFNRDGYSDLAIGVPGEDVGDIVDAGAVNLLYGGPNGLTAAGDQIWNQGASPAGALQETPEARDWFGASLAAGDFNDDGYADLAVGAPREDVTVGGVSVSDAGAVQIIYGSAAGLAPGAGPGNQLWNQNRGLADQPEAGDRFGESLAAADFNGDRRADLAIGAPGEDYIRADAGAVVVIYGAASGLSSAALFSGGQFLHQGLAGMCDALEADDAFGKVLAVGDFNDDGRADLAIGVPFEDVGDKVNAGQIHVLFGSASGLTLARNECWNQDSAYDIGGSIDEEAEPGERFGAALAASDFDGDGVDDLAIGVPYEDISNWYGLVYDTAHDSGAAHVLYGSTGGLWVKPGQRQLLHAGRLFSDAPILIGRDQHFGYALAAGYYRGSNKADLVVGIPGAPVDSAGAIEVFTAPFDPNSASPRGWRQGDNGLDGASEAGDEFGSVLA